MAFVHGKNQYVKIGTAVISSQLNSADFPQGAAASEVTGFGSDATQFIPGLKDTSISMSGYFDAATHGVLAGYNGTSVAFEYGPGGTAAASVKISGTCVITSVQVTGAVADAVALSISAQVTGAVTNGTY
jgi:hypothetical protein